MLKEITFMIGQLLDVFGKREDWSVICGGMIHIGVETLPDVIQIYRIDRSGVGRKLVIVLKDSEGKGVP